MSLSLIAMVPVRVLLDALVSTLNLRPPLPWLVVGAVSLIQGTSDVAVHVHSAEAAVIDTFPEAPVAATLPAALERATLQGAGPCVTTNPRPPIWSVAWRGTVVALARTLNVSMPVPVADLAYYDAASGRWVIERMPHTVLVGPSSRSTELLTATFVVVD